MNEIAKAAKPQKPKMSRNNRILTICVCIFLSILLIFGATLGIIMGINEANTVMKLGGVSMSEGVVRVFASYFKSLHLADLRLAGYDGAEDTDAFWASPYDEERTQGEVFLNALDGYISGIAAGANLYLNARGLSADDKAYIKSKTDAFITYYGSKAAFELEISRFGFGYDDFLRAMELSYAAERTFILSYGSDGKGLESADAEGLLRCEEYLSNYSRVKMIFFSNDDEALTLGELLQREQWAENLRGAIADESITDVMFDIYLNKEENDGDKEMNDKGYYFAKAAEQTARFAEHRPEVVEAAFDMKLYEFREVSVNDGVFFLYKCDIQPRAYTDDDNPFFSDFYLDAAIEFYTEDITTLSSDAVYKDSYRAIDFLKIPTNDRYFVTSWN